MIRELDLPVWMLTHPTCAKPLGRVRSCST